MRQLRRGVSKWSWLIDNWHHASTFNMPGKDGSIGAIVLHSREVKEKYGEGREKEVKRYQQCVGGCIKVSNTEI